MSWTRRSAGLLVAAVMVMPVAACTTGSGGGESSCAAQYTYQGSTYQDVANVKFTVGEKLGVVTSPPCDDTGGSDEDKEPVDTGSNAYEMKGISPKIAVAVGDTPETSKFFAVREGSEGSELPPEVQKLVDGS